MVSLRPAAVAPVAEPPRCLKVREAAVWALGPGDPLAAPRWRAAATRWRAEAHAAGMANYYVWQALPAGRFATWEDPKRLAAALKEIGCTEADLQTLTLEAEAAFGDLFAPLWRPDSSPESAWHLAEVRDRRGALGAP